MDNPTSNPQTDQTNQPVPPKPADQGQPQPVQSAPAQPSPPVPSNQTPPAAPPTASNPPSTPTPPPPADQVAQGPKPAPKKSNTGLIVALVLVGLLVVLGGGGYFGFRYLAGKANSAITSNASTDSSGSGSTADENPYTRAKDETPTDVLTAQVNNDLKPILEKLYGGVKLDGWFANEGTTTSMSYVVKNKATSADYAKIEQALAEKGYTKKENATTSNGFMVSFAKADITLVISFQSNLPYELVVGADKTSV